MKVLVIGRGGREHALAWKLAQSREIDKVYVAPGNGGTYREPKVTNINLDELDFVNIIQFVKKELIDFTVIGPEAPLANGIVDEFKKHKLLCLGPTQSCAMLESSKIFAKEFMQQNNIPTANAKSFTDISQAIRYLETQQFPIVIKADGLCAGKGVVIEQNFSDASITVKEFLENKKYGDASNSILIEEFLDGIEVSFIGIADGDSFIPFASSQDHKARDNEDKGPNTGGMGAVSPSPLVTDNLQAQIIKQVIDPVLKGFKKLGTPYTGFLYAGLMLIPCALQDNGFNIKVLEFNCRFGDPETQPVLMRLESDFAQICLKATQGKLSEVSEVKWSKKAAVGVVLAAKGYPNSYPTEDNLNHLKDIISSDEYKIFHAGTKVETGNILSNGGRVLCATALGNDLQEAQSQAYKVTKLAEWPNAYFRDDIGTKAINYNK